jgi:uncharacterized protein
METVPALPFIRRDPQGAYALVGSRCGQCGSVMLGERLACAHCCARSSLSVQTLPSSGRLRTFTIVHRSYPGIETPFISAVADLDQGGSLRGTLRGVEPTAAALALGMPLQIVFEDSGQRDSKARAQICHYFRPTLGSHT